MKLKKILALAVSLAMVLTIVPAFGLTASAASTTGVIDALGGEVLWGCPDGSFNDTAIGTAFSGWSSTITSGYVNVKTYSVGNTIQYYVNGTNNVTTITSPGYGGDGEDAIVIEWKMKRQTPSDLYFDFSFTDKNGTEIAFLKLDKNYTSVTGQYYMGYPADGTDCAIVATNNGDGTHKVEYYVGGSVVSTVSDKEGTISGFGGITSSNGRWSTAWNHIGFANLTIGAVSFSATKVDVTATYTANGVEVATATGSYDPAKDETVASFAEKYVVYNSDVYHAEATALSESGNIEMTKVDRYTSVPTGTVFMVDGEAYRSTGESLVTNGNFVTGDMSGWINRNLASDIEGESVAYDEEIGGNAVTISTGGAGATNSIGTKWTVTAGNTYYLSFYVGGTKPSSGNYQYNKVFDGSAELVAYGANMVDGQWTRFEKVFTAVNDYVLFQGSWASNIKYANVELVPVEIAADQKATTTIKFVDAEGTELQSSKAVTGLIGDVIDLTNTTLVPETITYNGNLYSKDASNPASYTVATAADEVTVTYSTDAVTSISPASATVIDGHTPLLPTTLAATTGTGAETTVTVTSWDTASLTVGSNTVYGTVEGLELKAEATVTVLPETFALDDKTTVNGQTEANNNVTAFPASITDEFVMEMDIVVASFGDLFITLKTAADTGFFGPEQIALGFQKDTGAFRPVNGNGAGGRTTADADLFAITTGTTYHLQVVSDPAQHKYTVTIFDDNGNSAVAENFGYRTNADSIGYLAMLTNNGSGSITASSIKVYNATLEASKTEYTVITTVDGVVESEVTGTYISVDQITAPEREGYELTKTVDGTTVTFAYVSTQTVSVKFVNAANEVIYSDSQVVSKDGSFTVPAQEIFVIASDNSGAFYQIPETVVNAADMVVPVSETPNKYAVIEDMLVSDNEVWGMKAANSNSVFVAAGEDANRGPLYDANGAAVTDGVHTPSTLGKSRVGFVEFPVVDLADGQKAIAKFYVRTWHENTFSNSNTSIRLAAYVVNDSSWTALSDGENYDSANAPILETYPNAIFSEAHGNYVDYITFDVTDAMKAAKAAGLEKFDLRLNTAWGAAYIAEREAAVLGGAYEGKAAYIEVVDAGAFEVTAETGSVTLTKNGSAVNGTATVTAEDDVRLVSKDAIVVETEKGNYKPNTNLNLTEATTFGVVAPYTFGIDLVNGAQVRVGDGVTAENKVGNGSGLRFIATVDTSNSVAVVTGVEYGLELTAAGSEKVVKFPVDPEKIQSEGVFTVAITNLAVSNYNRNYTATPYAVVTFADGTEETFRGTPVTRSIYAVSAGLLINSENAGEEGYALNETVKAVLNAYANQTGIRLAYNSTDGFAVGDYTGDVLFNVDSTYNEEDGSYTVTVTPINANVDLAAAEAWWTDYVRVNNNNSTAKTYISNASFNEGVLQFTFTFPSAE